MKNNFFLKIRIVLFGLLVSSYVQAGSGLYRSDQKFQECEDEAIKRGNAIRDPWNKEDPDKQWQICLYLQDYPDVSAIDQGAPYGYTLFRYELCIPNYRSTPYHYCIKPLPQFTPVEAVKQNRSFLTGNKDIKNQCGSVINPSKKTVSENIPIDGTNFDLYYSSEFNPKRMINKSLYGEYNFSQSIGLKRVEIIGSDGIHLDKFSILPTQEFTLNWPWDEKIGNQSIHPAMNKIMLGYNIEENKASASRSFFDSASVSSEFALIFKTIYDANGVPQTIILFSKAMLDSQLYSYELNWSLISAGNENITVYHPEVWGLGGWTISTHHYFERASKILFHGAGERRSYNNFKTVNVPGYGVVDMVSSLDDSEVYLFDFSGQHLETRSKILGKTLYKFNYATDHRLLSITDKYGQATQLIYDASGIISKIVSPNGQQTFLTTHAGAISQVENSLGYNYEMQYDDQKFLTQFLKPNQEITQFQYDAVGNFTTETKNTGLLQKISRTWNYLYRDFTVETVSGLKEKYVVSQSDQVDSTVVWNGVGNLVYRIDDKVGVEKTVSYLAGIQFKYRESSDLVWGRSLDMTTPVLETYNEPGMQSITLKPTQSTSYVYADNNDPTTLQSVQTISGQADHTAKVTTTLDVSARQIEIKDNSFNLISKIFLNPDETISRIQPATSYPTDFVYDNKGRLIKVKKGSAEETYAYDQLGFLSQITNSKNQVTQFIRNAKGQVLAKTLPNQDQILFEYTAGGDLKKITTPSQEVHYFQKDIGDYLTSYLSPNHKSTVYDYDSEKRIKKVTYPSGQLAQYNYESSTGHLLGISTSSGDYSYDGVDDLGRPHRLTSPDQIKSDINWIGSNIQSQKWYDADGSVIGSLSYFFVGNSFKIYDISINGAVVAHYNYDTTSGLVAAINSNTYSYSFTPDESGVSQQTIEVSGAVHATYQNFSTNSAAASYQTLQLSVNTDSGDSLLVNLKSSFDSFGQATEYSTSTINQDSGVVSSQYQLLPIYDENNRLIEVQKSRKKNVNGSLQSEADFYNQYGFPAQSNNNMKEFNQKIDRNGVAQKRTVATYGADDRLVKLRGSINRDYAYNEDGQLLTMSNCYGVNRYTYDLFGNLKKVILSNGQVVEYKTDALNRRIKKLVNGQTKNYYLWYDSTRLAAVLDENKAVKLIYIYGPESNAPSYVIKDGIEYRIAQDPGLGSIRYIIDSTTGQIAQEIEYDEYGNMMKNTQADFQPLAFAGGLYDQDTKLIRFGARDYDPSIGRWTSKDPSLFNGGTTNLYEYAFSDPMSYFDNDGLAPKSAQQPDAGVGGGTVSPVTGGSMSTTGGGLSNSTVYVSPNGQAVYAPQGSLVSPTRSGGGLRIDTGGGVQYRLMGPNGQSPNGYGKININGRFMDGSGNLLPPGSGDLPAAHLQPTCPPKGK